MPKLPLQRMSNVFSDNFNSNSKFFLVEMPAKVKCKKNLVCSLQDNKKEMVRNSSLN